MSHIIIPGSALHANSNPPQNVKITSRFRRTFSTMKQRFRTRLQAPFVIAKENEEGNLVVDIELLIPGPLLPVPAKDFQFHYDVVLNPNGRDVGTTNNRLYTLYLYCNPRENRTRGQHYHQYSFTIVLGPEAIRGCDDSIFFPVNEIGSVESIIVSKNPRTSRGTTTTVQPGG